MRTYLHLPVVVGLLIAASLIVTRVSASAVEDKQININTASATELGELQGIGEAKAREIVAYRQKNGPFKSVEDLGQVNGIGEKLIGKLRSHVTVGGAVAPAAAAAAAPKH